MKTNPQVDLSSTVNGKVKVGDRIVLCRRGKRQIFTAEFHYLDRNGQRQHGRKSLRTRNARIAEQKAKDLDEQLCRQEYRPEPESIRQISIADAIEMFVKAKQTDGCARKTIIKYAGELKNFATFLKDRLKIDMLSAVTMLHADRYKVHRKEEDELEPYTQNNHLIILKTWFKWCRKRGLIATNPLAEMELSRFRRRRHPAATLEQVNAVLTRATHQLFAILATLAFTGLRLGEVIALRREDVDLKLGIIHVCRRDGWDPKTEASERDVPIHPRLSAILAALNKPNATCFFSTPPSRKFPSGGNHVNPRDVNEQFQKLAKASGFNVARKNLGLTAHALRRFFKTFCLDSGVPKPMVDFWMGHRNQKDMDFFYYDPQKSTQWMAKVPFGGPNDLGFNH